MSVKLFKLIAFSLLIFLCVLGASAQNKDKSDLPVWKSYKGVAIGMTLDEVRQKLGAPKSESGGDLFYIFSETETADVMFDAAKKVRAISVMFTEDHTSQPKFEDVFGKGAASAAKPDGTIFKLIRFPAAGYWVSYSRLAGEKAMVTIMIQKL